MKFALVGEQRQEAQPGLSGSCPACGNQMLAKCGEVRIWHWAHQGNRMCDPWWENETEWHRVWKGHFPVNWQEVVQHSESGERHIADVKTDRGWVIEFQHSHIKPEERLSRDTFYSKLVWVVDGSRRKRDKMQLLHAWEQGTSVGANPRLRRTPPAKSVLLREWSGSPAPIFFDFGEETLWWLLKSTDAAVYVTPFPRNQLIMILRGGETRGALDFDAFTKEINKLVTDYEAYLRSQPVRQSTPIPLPGFRRH